MTKGLWDTPGQSFENEGFLPYLDKWRPDNPLQKLTSQIKITVNKNYIVVKTMYAQLDE